MQTIKAEKASNEVWDTIASQCDYATYFQTRQWAELCQLQSNGKIKPAARLLTLEDGTQVLIPMSATKVSGGLITQYVASAGWMYGGYLSAKPLTPVQSKIVWDYMLTLNLILRQNPFDPNPMSNRVTLIKQDLTQILDLKPGFDTLNKDWTKNSRTFLQQVRQAHKYGVTLEIATTLDEWRQYYAAYEDTIERLGDTFGGPKYQWEQFEYLFNLKSPNIKLWAAKYEGQVISGLICLYHNKIVHGWHAASLAKYFSMRPVQLIHFSIIEDACPKGYEWYDLGASTSKGVEDYKTKMGFVKKDFNAYMNKCIDLKTIEFIKSKALTSRDLVKSKVLSH